MVRDFQEGKYYFFTMNKRTENWNYEMDKVLDGKPRLCLQANIGCYATFEGLCRGFYWGHTFEYWNEVNIKNIKKAIKGNK